MTRDILSPRDALRCFEIHRTIQARNNRDSRLHAVWGTCRVLCIAKSGDLSPVPTKPSPDCPRYSS